MVDFEILTRRMLWQRFRHPTSTSDPFRRRKRNRPPIVKTVATAPYQGSASCRTIQHRVRQWPSGMPVAVDTLVATFGVGRSTAWHLVATINASRIAGRDLRPTQYPGYAKTPDGGPFAKAAYEVQYIYTYIAR